MRVRIADSYNKLDWISLDWSDSFYTKIEIECFNFFIFRGSVYDGHRGGYIALLVLFPRGFPLGRTVEAPNRP
jgi:hypothetical protein